ncbi:MAG: coiled-coil domain-containing protein [Rhodospirillaceae bacterium]
MSALAFDTHRIVKRLKLAGFTEEQAEAVTDAVQDAAALDLSRVATKDQVMALEARVDRLDAKFEAKFDQLDAKFEAKFGELDTRIGLVESVLSERIERRGAEMENRLVKLALGIEITTIVTLGGAIVGAAWAVIRALPVH